MYQKLADRLKLYEQNHPIKDDDGLMAAIEDILNEQDSLPIEERDFDLIAEATDSILKLQGYRESDRATMAEEAANSVKARIASHQKGITANGKPQNKHHSVLRWIIPLVAVLAMTTVAVFASPTNRLAISELSHRIYSSIIRKTVYHEDNIDLVTTSDTATFSTFEELSKSFNNSIELPFGLKDDLSDLEIKAYDFGDSFNINVSFVYCNSPCTIIITNQQNTSQVDLEYNYTVKNHNALLSECDDYILAEWIHGPCYYRIKAPNKNLMESIIYSLEVYDE